MTPELPIESFEIYATGLDHPECLAFDRACGKQACSPRYGWANPQPS